jgi:hypothetical protein
VGHRFVGAWQEETTTTADPCGDDDQKGKGNDNGLVVVVAGRKWTQ